MRINNIGVQSTFINFSNINKSAGQNHAKKSGQQEQSYSVSISPSGKANSLIDNLMKQRQNITDSKNDLVSRTLKSGGTMESIQSQLDSYNKQINDINMQIVQLTAQFAKDKSSKSDSSTNNEPKSDDQIQTEQDSSLIGLSSDLKQMKTVSSVKSKIDGEAGSLKNEIKLDDSRGGASASKAMGLADLENKSANIEARISESLGNISGDIKSGNNIHAVKHEHSDKYKNAETNTDTAQAAAPDGTNEDQDVKSNTPDSKQTE